MRGRYAMLVRLPALRIAALLAVTLALSVPAFAQDMEGMDMGGMEMGSGHDMSQMSDDGAMMDHDMHMGGNMKNMSLHMAYTDLRAANPADKARAAVLVTDLQHALAKYKNYHVAEADGFKPFHPEIKQQKVVHFTRNWSGLKASVAFNPDRKSTRLNSSHDDISYA